MNTFIFDIKQLKMNKFIYSIWPLIISNSNDTFEVISLRMMFIENLKRHWEQFPENYFYHFYQIYNGLYPPKIYLYQNFNNCGQLLFET